MLIDVESDYRETTGLGRERKSCRWPPVSRGRAGDGAGRPPVGSDHSRDNDSTAKTKALEALVIAGFVHGLSVHDVKNTLADAVGAGHLVQVDAELDPGGSWAAGETGYM